MKRFLASVACAIVLGGTFASPAAADLEQLPRPDNIVGLAWDEQADRLWIAGSEASQGKLVGYTEDGEVSTIEFSQEVRAVQALAIYDDQLYVADLGDESGASEIKILISRNVNPGKKEFRSYRLSYPRSATHSAAAMMVSRRGNIYIVTTGSDAGVYRAPKELSTSGDNELRRVADAPDGVLDGVFLSDGATIALRTESKLHLIDAFEWTLEATETYVGGPRRESITRRGEELIFASSEGFRTSQVPRGNGTTELPASVPTPQASPSPSQESEAAPTPESEPPSPSAAAEEGAAGAEAQNAQPAQESSLVTNAGTFVALGLAASLALLAGIVTFVYKT